MKINSINLRTNTQYNQKNQLVNNPVSFASKNVMPLARETSMIVQNLSSTAAKKISYSLMIEQRYGRLSRFIKWIDKKVMPLVEKFEEKNYDSLRARGATLQDIENKVVHKFISKHVLPKALNVLFKGDSNFADLKQTPQKAREVRGKGFIYRSSTGIELSHPIREAIVKILEHSQNYEEMTKGLNGLGTSNQYA